MAMPRLEDLPVPPKDLVKYIAAHPEMPMVDIMKPYRKYEADLRAVFAQDRSNPALEDPYLNVLPLFTEDTKLITARARNLEAETEDERNRYIMPLPADKRHSHGSPAVVRSIKEFQSNFSIFSESALADLNWDNVVAAGSSVINCLLPVPPQFNTTKRKLREYYHEKFCPASDVDLFLYGLTHEEAIEKIKEIERSIRDAILAEVTVVRTKYAITIASQYPTRHIQIVLRVYKSVGEILTGFDIDAAGGAYDGKQVYVAPRALGSFITQINHIDLTRRSPSYENRLSKYSHRNFEVYWPELDRSRVDPTIFERSFQRTLGLARLLVLERLPTSSSREAYTNKRRMERGRPTVHRGYYGRLGGNIKDSYEDEVADWVDETEVSNYHTFTVPYGPNFHAKKIEKLCYTRDLLLNAEWNQPKEREVYLHRHPAFFGRVEDIIEDCCGTCPEPKTPAEIETAEKEAEIYISGPVSFLIDNPGRQQIGSFNPLTEDDWTDMAYIGNTARLCQSIVDGDTEDVLNWLSQEGSDPNKRDYTGRSPLHLAVMSSTPEIVRSLVEHGARITARLADGRTALHLAAERGMPEMVRILMERSIENEAKDEEQQARVKAARFGGGVDGFKPAKKGEDETDETEEDDEDEEEEEGEDASSDGELVDGQETEGDHVSIATGSFVKVQKEDDGDRVDDIVPEESASDPDYYKIDVLSWDLPCSPLHLAIASGHEDVVSLLCEYGGDILLPVKFLNSDKAPTNAILTLALALTLPLQQAKQMATLLLKLGASSSQADLHGCTAFHRYVEKGDTAMIDTLWDLDKTGVKAALNHLIIGSQYWDPQAVSPLHTAIGNGDSIFVMRLLEAGATPHINFESWLKAAKFSTKFENRLKSYEENEKLYQRTVEQPLMTALRTCPDPEIAYRLLQGGADANSMTPISYQMLTDHWQRNYNTGQTALDVVRKQLSTLRNYTGEECTAVEPELPKNLDEYLNKFEDGSYQHWLVSNDIQLRRHSFEDSMKSYHDQVEKFNGLKGVTEKKEAISEAIGQLEKLEALITEKGGKTFEDLHPDIQTNIHNRHNRYDTNQSNDSPADKLYLFEIKFHNTNDVTDARQKAYLELFEAAWAGDLDKIKALTMQSWDEDQSEPPLKIAVKDVKYNNPFSLACLRGHMEVANAILEIAQAQYVPAEKENKHFTMETPGDDSDDGSEDEDSDGDGDSDSEPRIVGKTIDKTFTIENIGQVSMQVKSRTRPLEMLLWTAPTFVMKNRQAKDTRWSQMTLLRFATHNDDRALLKSLIDMGVHFASQKLEGDAEEASGFFTFPEDDFLGAVKLGRLQLLADIIKRTGAGIPLDHLVKKSGIAVKDKPRYYQGLTVYGKKRKDWANAGRDLVVKSTGIKTPPLLHAALDGSIESVEWFLSDAPHRHYAEFGTSKAARNDSRLKHLNQASGGFERSVSKWLGLQNELILHCAVMGPPSDATSKLVEYVVQAFPTALEARNSAGDTPLMTAAWLGRTRAAKILIDAGADQSVRNKSGYNIIHYALEGQPPAAQLRTFLELLDADLLSHHFQTRSNLQDYGTTPLHAFVYSTTQKHRYYHSGTYRHSNETIDLWLDRLKLVLELSRGAELEMLNGAGDTPLHTAVMHASVPMVRALLDFRPALLYRENAVGRTPAELARDRVTAQKFAAPSEVRTPNDRLVVTKLVGKAPADFVEGDDAASSTGDGEESDASAVWRICLEVMEKNPGKRRLVSLNEANDVAKRLGEKHTASRYFSIQARDDDDEEDEDGDEREAKNADDFSVQQRNTRWNNQWACERCLRRH